MIRKADLRPTVLLWWRVSWKKANRVKVTFRRRKENQPSQWGLFGPPCLCRNYHGHKMQALRWAWKLAYINNRHQLQLKFSKSWEPFWSYQLNSPAKPADSPKNEANRLAWKGCLAHNSKTAPRILKISIVMGADYWSELIFMPTWVLAFCAHNIFCLDRVYSAQSSTRHTKKLWLLSRKSHESCSKRAGVRHVLYARASPQFPVQAIRVDPLIQ